MAEKTRPNDAAFGSEYGSGLTKREHFAALAMQGILAATPSKLDLYADEEVASESLRHADALIAALNDTSKTTSEN